MKKIWKFIGILIALTVPVLISAALVKVAIYIIITPISTWTLVG